MLNLDRLSRICVQLDKFHCTYFIYTSSHSELVLRSLSLRRQRIHVSCSKSSKTPSLNSRLSLPSEKNVHIIWRNFITTGNFALSALYIAVRVHERIPINKNLLTYVVLLNLKDWLLVTQNKTQELIFIQ